MSTRIRLLAALVAAVLAPPALALAHPPGSGSLTSEESPDPDNGPTHYVYLADGTPIALNVSLPEGCSSENPCPTIFEMSGYESGSADGDTPAGSLDDFKDATFRSVFGEAADEFERDHDLPLQDGTRAQHGVLFDDEYAVVLASVRGTGCSGGEFDLFSWRSAVDGREIIDGWIARQPWSDGDVGIFGHSYSGITGTMVAATRPHHLRVLSVSGLIGDLYRDIVYPGGITNYGFPLLWTGAVRPLYDVGGGLGGGMIGGDVVNPDPRCAANQATKSRTVLGEPVVNGVQDTDGEWFRSRSLYPSVDKIDVPIHITTAYQDEQTGPRGAYTVWDHLPDDVSRRLVNVNGIHGTQVDGYIRQDRLAWIDYWMLDRDQPTNAEAAVFDEFPAVGQDGLAAVFGPRDEATATTRTFLGFQGGDQEVAQLVSDGFPYSQTDFEQRFVTTGETGRLELASAAPDSADSAAWIHGSRRQSYSHQAGVNEGSEVSTPSGPDELELFMDFDEPSVMAGPATASFWISSTAPETELFVQLIDEDPTTGEMLYLQRGMLRGGHRAVDAEQSGYFEDTDGDTVMWRPHRPHTGSVPVIPGEPVRYDIEIFPFGHVFEAGHRLVVKVHAPPADDNDYNYVPKTAAAVNTLHFGPDTPSSLWLPTVAVSDVLTPGGALNFPASLCDYHRIRCVPRQENPLDG